MGGGIYGRGISWTGEYMWYSFFRKIIAWMEGSLIGRGLFLGFPTSHLRYQQFSQSKRMVPVQPLSILDIGLHVVRPKQIIWILVMIRFLTIGGDCASSPPSTSAAISVQSDQLVHGRVSAAARFKQSLGSSSQVGLGEDHNGVVCHHVSR